MKMKKLILFLGLSILFSACDIEGVKKTDDSISDLDVQNDTVSKTDTVIYEEEVQDTEELELLGEELEQPESIKYENGVEITWKRKGEGKKITAGNLVDIDYRVSLEDGGVYDGNHLVKKKSIPFLVGWNMQTKGWDFAFEKLTEGDDVEIFLPANLARGEKGIPGIVPPNANNIISVRVFGIRQPTVEVDEIRIWRVEQSKSPGDTIAYGDEVYFHYMVSSQSNPRYDNSYQRGEEFVYVMGEDNVIPGLYKALHYARKGDKLMIHIPSKDAFGKEGLKGLVKPNEDLFYDILITEVVKAEKDNSED
jgi:FKBP-type peptidyl-prolyl cis-trans isomerase